MEWLKKAEDLFENVDRRAKLVVSEFSEEHPDSQASGSTKQGSQTKGTKSKRRAQKRLSTNESSKVKYSAEDSSKQTKNIDTLYPKDEAAVRTENKVILSEKPANQINNDEAKIDERDTSVSEIPQSDAVADTPVKHDANDTEVQSIVSNMESTPSIKNRELVNDNVSVPKVEGEDLNASNPEIKNGQINKDLPASSSPKVISEEKEIATEVDVERSEPETDSSSKNNGTQPQGADLKVENIDQKVQPEQKAEKVQEQLEEAQGLLKNAVSTGQSKEARLARVCAGLSTRLQEYKYENAQLEELLNAERELSKSYEASINQLHKELSASRSEITRIESNMAEALAAKNSEIETLLSSMDALKKQAALSEGNLASLQANMENIMRNRELTETRMMQAVREELASVERRAEEERTAHNATKMAAMEREVELEQRAVEASSALARAQRLADERMSKAAELEQKVALLEVECASLNQELQDMEARVRIGQKKAPEEANQVIQMQAWQEEVERARQSQREAENKLSSMEAEMQKMRVEMASMKRDAEHYSRQEHMELEKRYRELTDLLYHKQTQLETMASEKAAAEFQLEKELRRVQEAQVEAERNRVSRRPSTTWEEDTEIKALEPLPLYHRHMIGARAQLQKAAKFLDTGAVRATRFLWRYPTARVCLLIYLVFVHLFLMYLLHRLQEQADSNAAREVAESMGLSTSKLP